MLTNYTGGECFTGKAKNNSISASRSSCPFPPVRPSHSRNLRKTATKRDSFYEAFSHYVWTFIGRPLSKTPGTGPYAISMYTMNFMHSNPHESVSFGVGYGERPEARPDDRLPMDFATAVRERSALCGENARPLAVKTNGVLCWELASHYRQNLWVKGHKSSCTTPFLVFISFCFFAKSIDFFSNRNPTNHQPTHKLDYTWKYVKT